MPDEIQTPEGTEPTEVVTPAENSETTEIETPQTPEVEEQVEQPQQPQVDYKQKFVESQREAILLNERNKQKDAHISKLTSKDTPTDDELRTLYPWWDDPKTDEATKDFYRDQAATKRELKQTQNIALSLAEKLEFQEKLDDFIETPPDQFKGLKVKEAEFKRFAKRKDNIGLPLETLAKAFLFDVSDEISQTTPVIKTPGLENGSGGPRTAPKPKKMPIEEASELRQTNYQEYRRLVLAGQIEEEF